MEPVKCATAAEEWEHDLQEMKTLGRRKDSKFSCRLKQNLVAAKIQQ